MNVLELYNRKYQAKKKGNTHGGEYCGPCPACGGNDRFLIWPLENQNRGSYWCRQCERSGDNIQFLIDFEGKTFRDACEQLGIEMKKAEGRAQYKPPADETKQLWEPRQATTPAGQWREKALSFVRYAHEKLISNKEQLDYLRGRGIDFALVEKFSLGYNPETMWRPRSAWGLPDETKEGGSLKKLCLPAGIVIPCFSRGTLSRIRVRTGRQNIPYYLIPGSSPDPMIIEPAQPYKYTTWLIEESELDGIMLSSIAADIPGAGIMPCGNTSVRPTAEQVEFLRAADCLLIAMDHDGKPGVKASAWWLEHFDNAERWIVLSGKDPGESYRNGDDLREWIVAGLPPRHRLAVRSADAARSAQVVAGGQELRAKSQEPAAGTVQRLYDYLRKYPVRIVNTEVQTQLIFDRKWEDKHGEESREISRLLFSDEGLDYIRKHPEKLIDRKNFIING